MAAALASDDGGAPSGGADGGAEGLGPRPTAREVSAKPGKA